MSDNVQTPESPIPRELHALLVAQWAQSLAADRLGTTQSGSGTGPGAIQTFSFGNPTEAHFVLRYLPESDNWSIGEVAGFAQADVTAIVQEAIAHAKAMATGPDVVFRVVLSTAEVNLLGGGFGLHFMRLLGDQVRIEGWRRLGDRVILEFVEEAVEQSQPLLLAPRTQVTATLFVPGPVAGPLAQRTAGGLAEIVSAICTLALGRVVSVGQPVLYPLASEDVEAASQQRHDPAILGLARDRISLDIFGDLTSRAGGDGMLRARGALLSYQAALEQRYSDTAVMLLVTSIEALIVPRAPWAKDKVTKRFIWAVGELCPTAVDDVVNHANVEQAFIVKLRGNPRRRRRDLLDTIYAMRSNPTHTGVGPSRTGALLQLADAGGMRVALLSNLARSALLAYLVAPRSSLVGHPLIDPATRLSDEQSTG